MANIKSMVKLSPKERKELLSFVSTGVQPAKLIRRSEIVLALDTANGRKPQTEQEIADIFNISKQTVHVVKQDFLSLKTEDFLHRKQRTTPPVPAKVDGNVEAHIIALCCSNPPEGYSRWTVRLLADKCVELGYVDSISHMTVSRTLKKTSLNLT